GCRSSDCWRVLSLKIQTKLGQEIADLARQVTAASRKLAPRAAGRGTRQADAFRDATNTPVSTSAKPMKWNACGRSPRKAIDMTVPNTGTTWKNGAARLAPINCTPRLKQR